MEEWTEGLVQNLIPRIPVSGSQALIGGVIAWLHPLSTMQLSVSPLSSLTVLFSPLKLEYRPHFSHTLKAESTRKT